jgi:hypothetical protein
MQRKLVYPGAHVRDQIHSIARSVDCVIGACVFDACRSYRSECEYKFKLCVYSHRWTRLLYWLWRQQFTHSVAGVQPSGWNSYQRQLIYTVVVNTSTLVYNSALVLQPPFFDTPVPDPVQLVPTATTIVALNLLGVQVATAAIPDISNSQTVQFGEAATCLGCGHERISQSRLSAQLLQRLGIGTANNFHPGFSHPERLFFAR